MKKLVVLTAAMVGITFASCNKSDIQKPEVTGKPNELPVQVSLSPVQLTQPGDGFSSASLTKATAQENEALSVTFGQEATKAATALTKPEESKVYNVWAIQFKADGTLLGAPYYTADVPNPGAGTAGNDATYTNLSVNLTSNTEAGGKVYFITNTNSPSAFNTTNAANENAMFAVAKNITNQWAPTAEGGIPMLGLYTGAVSSGTALSNVAMKRLVAKVILKYKVDASFAGFDITNVTLKNVASKMYYRSEITNNTTIHPAKNVTVGSESHIDYSTENLANAGTDGDYKTFTWYIPENLRGRAAGVTAAGDRILSATDGLATYIEIKGTLKTSAKCEKATYAILLGDPTTNVGDFNVKRNNVYTVTTNIQGTNIADHRVTVESFDMSNSAMIVPNSGAAGGVTFDVRKMRYLNTAGNATLPTFSSGMAGRAAVLWTDNASLPAGLDINYDKANGLLTVFSKNAQVGNAIIAVYDANTGGNILWSWHIWVSAYKPDGSKAYGLATNSKANVTGGEVHTYGAQFAATNPGKVIMDRNLGATRTYYTAPASTATVADEAFGMFYQWGRKDPFPRVDGSTINATTATGTTITIYGSAGTALDAEVSDAAGTGYRKMNITGAGIEAGGNTLTYSVRNPLAFIYNAATPYDWYTSTAANQNNALWGDGAQKSPYDPCPAGWRIAPNGTWSDFTRDAATPLNGTFPYYSDAVVGETYAAGNYKVTNGRLYKVSTSGTGTPLAWYPAPGYRRPYSGELVSVGSGGHYWSRTPSGVLGYGFNLNPTDISPSNAGCSRADARLVRCLQE